MLPQPISHRVFNRQLLKVAGTGPTLALSSSVRTMFKGVHLVAVAEAIDAGVSVLVQLEASYDDIAWFTSSSVTLTSSVTYGDVLSSGGYFAFFRARAVASGTANKFARIRASIVFANV